MKDLITKEYNGVEVHFEIIDGESYVAIEDVARFCGWTQVKNGKEYIRYERINEKLSLLSFPNVGENDYIPEKVFYPLVGMGIVNNSKKAMYNKVYNKTSRSIDDVVGGIVFIILTIGIIGSFMLVNWIF